MGNFDLALPDNTQSNYALATNAAGVCKEIVLRTACNIQGRNYVKVEGWQAIAAAHGCTASIQSVKAVDGGVSAVAEVRRIDTGAVICVAEGFVGQDEPTWYGGEITSYGKKKTLPKRADYAIRAMAQTRAMSRACRSAFAHVVVLMNAGLETTPAEEVPIGGFQDEEPRGKVSIERTTGKDAAKEFGDNLPARTAPPPTEPEAAELDKRINGTPLPPKKKGLAPSTPLTCGFGDGKKPVKKPVADMTDAELDKARELACESLDDEKWADRAKKAMVLIDEEIAARAADAEAADLAATANAKDA